MSEDECVVGYDANSDNGFVIEEDTSSVEAYDGGAACLSDNFSDREEEEETGIIYKNPKIKFSVIKKTRSSYTIILQEEDDFI